MARMLAVVALVACSSESPQDAARLHNLQLNDGFRSQGAALIHDRYVVTALKLVERAESASARTAAGDSATLKLLTRGADVGLAVLEVRDKKLAGAQLGRAAPLQAGAAVTSYVFPADGAARALSGMVAGWRYHESKAYLQTDLDAGKDDLGSGVYDVDGALIGVIAFQRGPKLTYVLPIEYALNGKRSVLVHPDLARDVGSFDDSSEFAAIRADAQKHPGPLPAPITFNTVSFTQYYSKTALVGELALLAKAGAALHQDGARYSLSAVNAERARRALAEGPIEAANLRWHVMPEEKDKMAKLLAASYGDDYVEAHLAPFDFGMLRYRVPLAAFCPAVSDQEVHVLTVALADGRSSGDIGFSDLVNICAATEESEGDQYEQQWGMGSGATVPVTAGAGKKGKKGGKAKKRKR